MSLASLRRHRTLVPVLLSVVLASLVWWLMSLPTSYKFAGLPSPFGASIITVTRPDITNLSLVEFPAGTDSEHLSENVIYLIHTPPEGLTPPRVFDLVLRTTTGALPNYFGYRYTSEVAAIERNAASDAPFSQRFPGTFFASVPAMTQLVQYLGTRGVTQFMPGSSLTLDPSSLYVLVVNEHQGATLTVRQSSVSSSSSSMAFSEGNWSSSSVASSHSSSVSSGSAQSVTLRSIVLSCNAVTVDFTKNFTSELFLMRSDDLTGLSENGPIYDASGVVTRPSSSYNIPMMPSGTSVQLCNGTLTACGTALVTGSTDCGSSASSAGITSSSASSTPTLSPEFSGSVVRITGNTGGSSPGMFSPDVAVSGGQVLIPLDTGNTTYLAQCSSLDCSSASQVLRLVQSWGGVGGSVNRILVPSDGLPVFLNEIPTSGTVNLMKCTSPVCASWSVQGLGTTGGGQAALSEVAVGLGADGFPVVAFTQNLPEAADHLASIRVVHCTSASCGSSVVGSIGEPSASVVLLDAAVTSTGKLPMILYRSQRFTGDAPQMKLAACTDASCSSVSTVTIPEPTPVFGDARLVMAGDVPIVVYTTGQGIKIYDGSIRILTSNATSNVWAFPDPVLQRTMLLATVNGSLHLLSCDRFSCGTITRDLLIAPVASDAAMYHVFNGNAFIVYFDPNVWGIQYIRCSNTSCTRF